MSSINIDSEVSGEDIRNLTMQWNYASTTKTEQRRERRERTPLEIPSLISSAFSFFCMLAGASTTIAIFIAVQEGWINTGELTALLF